MKHIKLLKDFVFEKTDQNEKKLEAEKDRLEDLISKAWDEVDADGDGPKSVRIRQRITRLNTSLEKIEDQLDKF